jgi:predicted metal-dependent phosphotriesterase family hydrolase
VFVPKLRQAGVNDQMIRRITIENPRRFLTFVPAR